MSSNGFFATLVGLVLPYAGETSPDGFLMCDGSAVSRTTYANLFAIIGTTYGAGNGTTTFNLPDMRGKSPFGKSTDTQFNLLGKTGGNLTHKHKGYGDADTGETAGDLRAAVGSPYGDAQRLGFIATAATNPNDNTEANFTYSVPGSASGNGSNGRMSHYSKVFGYTSTKSSLSPYLTLNYIIKF